MTPTFKIIAAGNDVTADISARLISLEITDSVDENSDKASITLHNSDGTLAVPASGVSLEIYIGYDGNNERLGAFIVDQVDLQGPPNIVKIESNSTPFSSDKNGTANASFTSHRSRSFEGQTLQQIVETIAGECGLSPAIDYLLGPTVVPHISQVDESNANLLIRLARKYGGVLKPADGRLVFARAAGGTTITGQAFAHALTPSMVSTWKFRLGGKMLGKTKVASKCHDYNAAQTQTATSDIGDDAIDETDE